MNNNHPASNGIADTSPAQAEPRVYTVLLVDDQKMVGEAVRRMLANHPDIQFHYCDSAEQALPTAEQIHPTVILQDLVMPGMDGLSLVGQYRAHPVLRDVPIIVFSTKEEPAVKSAAFKVGANDYLVKLPDPVELLARIRYHSKAYMNQMERDRVYHELRENQRQLIAANEELQRLNKTDDVTGLRKQQYMGSCLAEEWKRGSRERTMLSMLMIEMDDFKPYVDANGDMAGKNALKQIAKAVQQAARRPADLAARYEDEKIIVVFPNTSSEGVNTIAEKIRLHIENMAIQPAFSRDKGVTVSVGIATCVPTLDHHADCLIAAADQALKVAKQAGASSRYFIQLNLGNDGSAPKH